MMQQKKSTTISFNADFLEKKTLQNRLFKMFHYAVQTSFDLLSTNVSHIFIVLLNLYISIFDEISETIAIF